MAGTWVRGLHAVRAGCGCVGPALEGALGWWSPQGFRVDRLLIGNFGRCFLHGLGSEVQWSAGDKRWGPAGFLIPSLGCALDESKLIDWRVNSFGGLRVQGRVDLNESEMYRIKKYRIEQSDKTEN